MKRGISRWRARARLLMTSKSIVGERGCDHYAPPGISLGRADTGPDRRRLALWCSPRPLRRPAAAATTRGATRRFRPTSAPGCCWAQLTLDEKISLMAGDDPSTGFNQAEPVEDRHTGESQRHPPRRPADVFYSDGPVGTRQGKATGMPASIGLAATWDVDIARRYGAVVGNEVKLKGNDVVHAPTVNIMRTPLGGRTFEGYGEDPWLTSRIGVAWIRGAQSEGVVGNVKHYAANNQEPDRFVTNAIVDQRTLREIYLPAFEAAVKEANVGTRDVRLQPRERPVRLREPPAARGDPARRVGLQGLRADRLRVRAEVHGELGQQRPRARDAGRRLVLAAVADRRGGDRSGRAGDDRPARPPDPADDVRLRHVRPRGVPLRRRGDRQARATAPSPARSRSPRSP